MSTEGLNGLPFEICVIDESQGTAIVLKYEVLTTEEITYRNNRKRTVQFTMEQVVGPVTSRKFFLKDWEGRS